MNARDLLPFVSAVLDTALSPDHSPKDIREGDYIVAYLVGGEPRAVGAVVSTYTSPTDAQDARGIVEDYLDEVGMLPADAEPVVVRVEREDL